MSMINSLIKTFNNTDFIMNLVIGDLNNEQAKTRLRDNKGASISWIVGHLLSYRYVIMNLFGANKENKYLETYMNKSAESGENYPEISELLKTWNELSNEFYAVLKNVSDDDLMSKIDDGGPHKEKTKLDTLSFYTWHEAYHMGVIGIIRTELGLSSTANLAVAASKSK